MSRTLFTSLYIDRLLWPEPKSVEDAQFHHGTGDLDGLPLIHTVLRSYCVAVVRCCFYVIGKMHSQDYYEEEDFATHTYNRPLLEFLLDGDVVRDLDNGIKWLEEHEHSGLVSSTVLKLIQLSSCPSFRWPEHL